VDEFFSSPVDEATRPLHFVSLETPGECRKTLWAASFSYFSRAWALTSSSRGGLEGFTPLLTIERRRGEPDLEVLLKLTYPLLFLLLRFPRFPPFGVVVLLFVRPLFSEGEPAQMWHSLPLGRSSVSIRNPHRRERSGWTELFFPQVRLYGLFLSILDSPQPVTLLLQGAEQSSSTFC